MDFVNREKAMLIRVPSTANLMVDSADRAANYTSAFNFQITKRQNILNGFFTRIGTTEVVLEWCETNIKSGTNGNNSISVDISGVGGNTYTGTLTPAVISGFYTVEDILDALVADMNTQTGTTGATFDIVRAQGVVYLDCSGAEFRVGDTPLARQLEIYTGGVFVPAQEIICPDLRPYRYIDFVCPTLTYAQDVKDTMTQTTERDVLCRWYFSYDDQPQLDGYGFPILMGYTRFCLRRIFNPPKQIKWDSNLPVGNLVFQVYDEDGVLIPGSTEEGTQWLMTLQASEA